MASTSGWLNKVPEITLSFWIIKIMSTTVGETGADFLAVNAGLGQNITCAIMSALLLIALTIQLRTKRYTPWIYWLTVVLVSIVGTQITDLLTDGLNISLYLSTSVFSVALAVIFSFGIELSEPYLFMKSFHVDESYFTGLLFCAPLRSVQQQETWRLKH